MPVPSDPQEAQLLGLIASEPRHIDELMRASSMTPAQISSLLAVMELKGLVRQVGLSCYVRA